MQMNVQSCHVRSVGYCLIDDLNIWCVMTDLATLSSCATLTRLGLSHSEHLGNACLAGLGSLTRLKSLDLNQLGCFLKFLLDANAG